MSNSNRNENPQRLVYVDGISNGVMRGNYGYIRPSVQPLWFNSAAAVPAFPTASAGQTDIGYAENGLVLELFQTLAQTLMPTIHATKGLNIACDQTNNDALEIVVGSNVTVNSFANTAGTTPNSFFKVTFELTDVDGQDELVIGWRRQQTYSQSAAFDGTTDPVYTDFAAIGLVGATDGSISTVTDLNDSGTPTKTDTLFDWADAGIHTLEVRIVGRKAIYLINGVRVGADIRKDGLGATITTQSTRTPPAFTFDSTDVLVPFIFLRQAANLGEGIYIRELEVGQLQEVGKDDNARGSAVIS